MRRLEGRDDQQRDKKGALKSEAARGRTEKGGRLIRVWVCACAPATAGIDWVVGPALGCWPVWCHDYGDDSTSHRNGSKGTKRQRQILHAWPNQ